MSSASAGTSDSTLIGITGNTYDRSRPSSVAAAPTRLWMRYEIGSAGTLTSLPDRIAADDAQLIVVLEEAARAAAHIGRMRAAEDLERRHLDRRDVQPRFIGHDLRVVAFVDRARQHHRERFADRDRAGARLPPAANRLAIRAPSWIRVGRACGDATARLMPFMLLEGPAQPATECQHPGPKPQAPSPASWDRDLVDHVADHCFRRQSMSGRMRTQPDAMAEHERRQVLDVFRKHFRAAPLQQRPHLGEAAPADDRARRGAEIDAALDQIRWRMLPANRCRD